MNIFRKYYAFVQYLQNFTNFFFCFVCMVFFVLDLFCQGVKHRTPFALHLLICKRCRAKGAQVKPRPSTLRWSAPLFIFCFFCFFFAKQKKQKRSKKSKKEGGGLCPGGEALAKRWGLLPTEQKVQSRLWIWVDCKRGVKGLVSFHR